MTTVLLPFLGAGRIGFPFTRKTSYEISPFSPSNDLRGNQRLRSLALRSHRFLLLPCYCLIVGRAEGWKYLIHRCVPRARTKVGRGSISGARSGLSPISVGIREKERGEERRRRKKIHPVIDENRSRRITPLIRTLLFASHFLPLFLAGLLRYSVTRPRRRNRMNRAPPPPAFSIIPPYTPSRRINNTNETARRSKSNVIYRRNCNWAKCWLSIGQILPRVSRIRLDRAPCQ